MACARGEGTQSVKKMDVKNNMFEGFGVNVCFVSPNGNKRRVTEKSVVACEREEIAGRSRGGYGPPARENPRPAVRARWGTRAAI